MSKNPENNQEDDEARYPANHLVPVNHLVPEQRDDEGANGDDENASKTWNVAVDRMDELSACTIISVASSILLGISQLTNDDIDAGPSQAC